MHKNSIQLPVTLSHQAIKTLLISASRVNTLIIPVLSLSKSIILRSFQLFMAGKSCLIRDYWRGHLHFHPKVMTHNGSRCVYEEIMVLYEDWQQAHGWRREIMGEGFSGVWCLSVAHFSMDCLVILHCNAICYLHIYFMLQQTHQLVCEHWNIVLVLLLISYAKAGVLKATATNYFKQRGGRKTQIWLYKHFFKYEISNIVWLDCLQSGAIVYLL